MTDLIEKISKLEKQAHEGRVLAQEIMYALSTDGDAILLTADGPDAAWIERQCKRVLDIPVEDERGPA